MAQAVGVHDESLRILPRNASIRAAAVRFWIDRGKGARALELLETGLRQDPRDAALAALRIRLLAAGADPTVRDLERAVRLVAQLLAGPDAHDPRVLSAAGVVAAERGDFVRAIELAERAATLVAERDADTLAERIGNELARYRERLSQRTGD